MAIVPTHIAELNDEQVMALWHVTSEWVETAHEFIGDDGPGVHEEFDKYLPVIEPIMGELHDEAVRRGLHTD